MTKTDKQLMVGLQTGANAFVDMMNVWLESLEDIERADQIRADINDGKMLIRASVGITPTSTPEVIFFEVPPKGEIITLFAVYGRDHKTN